MRNPFPQVATALAIFFFLMTSVVFAQQENTQQKAPEQVARVANEDATKKTAASELVDKKVDTSSAPAADPDGWHFEVSPYVWLSGLEGDLRVSNTTVHVDSSPADLLKQLDFAFATRFEASKGKFGIILDENYVNLGTNVVGPLGVVTDVQPTLNIFEFGGSYAPVIVPNKNSTASTPLPPTFSLEIVGGGRYTHFGLDLNRPILSMEGNRNIVDAFIGNRVKVRPHPAVTLIGKYTVGGGGSHFAWTAAGLVDVRLKPRFSMWGGYQALDMDADQPGNTTGINGQLRGVILGFTMYR